MAAPEPKAPLPPTLPAYETPAELNRQLNEALQARRKGITRARLAEEEADTLRRGGFIEPSTERRQHGLVVRSDNQIPDINGDIGDPFIALDTLSTMLRKGTIQPELCSVGEKFHDTFRRASLDQLHAAALIRIPSPAMWWREGGGNDQARRQIAEAIRALGGEISLSASCAWHVLGLEWSLREWSIKALRSNVAQASGVLISTLWVLKPHFLA